MITEGISEFMGIPLIADQLRARTRHTLLNPLKVNVSPDAPPAKVAAATAKMLKLLHAQRADLVVLLLDRENQAQCPGQIASALEASVSDKFKRLPIRVVLKDQKLENWLLADLSAMASQPRRFVVTNSLRRQIEPNRADRCGDAEQLLKSAIRGPAYEKAADSKKIFARMDVENAARNSRSFRHFLHILEDERYKAQCKKP